MSNKDTAVCTTVCGLPDNDDELKKLLTPEQYKIMKENGTERPFNNEYWNNHEPGIYVDRISGVPLFSSKDKFDSGTGWPSFTKPLSKGSLQEITDDSHGMSRTEVRAAKSDSHLGHVFNDGPAPTGLRYCMNSASLLFVPAKDLEKNGLEAYAPDFGIKAVGDAGNGTKDTVPVKLEKATFAAGCFWGVEETFRNIDGVKSTMVGYTGGKKENPTYKEVCTDTTGHAEAVEVEYDPAKVSYAQLLDVFWKNHNPTTLNRQGPDVGTQYRSAIFYHSPEQKQAAEESLKALEESGRYGNKKIVTQIVPATTFNKAEEYHQKYLAKNGLANCHL
ncbi:bifunctional methionine sulfoxide reductase B/A protein [Candidatus Sumerlaeota bacterium]|nr:bifunctional methionine sulfoxide reductase B/A protein [Candidatus Sumerlaeota bacterium]